MKVLQNYYLFVFIVTSWFQYALCSRKYDIEQECQKLYKEDLETVLARFRRTPEYLRIITDKNSALQLDVEDILRHTLYHWHEKVGELAEKRLGLDKEDAGIPAAAGGKDAPLCRKSFPLDNRFGNWLHPDPWDVRGAGAGARARAVRKALRDGSGETTTKSGVDLLDGYGHLHSHLTVVQKNAMKDLGFELAGNVIHAIIAALGPDESQVRSTRHPFGGDTNKEETTTEHVTKHEVTTVSVTPEQSEMQEEFPDAVRSGSGGSGGNGVTAFNNGVKGVSVAPSAGKGEKQQHRMKIKNPRDETKRRTPTDVNATNDSIVNRNRVIL